MGLLLDIEIIRLTNGKKTLKDIILELVDKYGATKPFDEEDFFDEFTARVHPDLRYWFADYVEGTVPLNLKDGLDQIGVLYSEKGSTKYLSAFSKITVQKLFLSAVNIEK